MLTSSPEDVFCEFSPDAAATAFKGFQYSRRVVAMPDNNELFISMPLRQMGISFIANE